MYSVIIVKCKGLKQNEQKNQENKRKSKVQN